MAHHVSYGRRGWRILEELLVYLSVVLVVVVFLFPIYWIVATSFKTTAELFAWPPSLFFFIPTLQNYVDAFSAMPLASYFLNTTYIATVTAVISLVTGALAAYALVRFQFKGKKLLGGWILISQFIPPIVLVLPLFVLFTQLRLNGTFAAQIIGNTSFLLPLAAYLMIGYFQNVPEELEQAAMIDGTSHIGAFFRITLPLASPGLAAVGILCLIFAWNSFLVPLTVSSEATKPLSLALTGFQTGRGIQWGAAAAASTVTVLPVLILSLFVQRYIVQGLTRGAVD